MSIVRVKKDKNFSVINNTVLNDVRLSWQAKGLAAYLLSRHDDWKIIRSHLAKQSADGEGVVRSSLKELEKCGYLVTIRSQNSKGLFDWEHTLHETPQIVKSQSIGKNPPVDEPPVDEPPVENRTLLSTEVVSTDLPSTDVASTELPNPTQRDARGESPKATAKAGWVGLPSNCPEDERWSFELLTDKELGISPQKAYSGAQKLTPYGVVATVASWLADKDKGKVRDAGALVYRLEHPVEEFLHNIPPAFLSSALYARHYPLTESETRVQKYDWVNRPAIADWIAELPYPESY